jgi:hypothetical protein
MAPPSAIVSILQQHVLAERGRQPVTLPDHPNGATEGRSGEQAQKQKHHDRRSDNDPGQAGDRDGDGNAIRTAGQPLLVQRNDANDFRQ